MDILICRVRYPNDPTNSTHPHMHFVGFIHSSSVELFSISSLQGKRWVRNNPDCFIITDWATCCLKAPSFINCGVSYVLDISKIDISGLRSLTIPASVRSDIETKIADVKKAGRHQSHTIGVDDFINLNSLANRL